MATVTAKWITCRHVVAYMHACMCGTKRIDAVVNCTPIHIKNKAKFTNLMKIFRIEGYDGN